MTEPLDDPAPDVSEREAQELAEELAEATARYAARHGFAIDEHRARDHFVLSAAPVAVVFDHPLNRLIKPTHRSGRISPELLPFLVDATLRTKARLAYAEGEDNPFLIALVLASFHVCEAQRTGALGIARVVGDEPLVELLRGDAAMEDVTAKPGTVKLRTVVPVEDAAEQERVTAVQFSWTTSEPPPFTPGMPMGEAPEPAAADGHDH